MKLLLLRDEGSTAHPAPEQVSVGELVMNSVTGKLYTKLTDGSLVEFIGQKVCYGPIPAITFSDTFNFCCYNQLLYVTVRGLLPEPKSYTFEFDELTGNSSSGSVSTPNYSSYTVSNGEGIPEGQTVTLREAVVPVNVSISSPENVNIFKFSVFSDNVKITEKTLAVTCNVC